MFQFQNGAIISWQGKNDNYDPFMFQFQNGAIIRFKKGELYSPDSCFNSKMVRL